MKRNKDIIKTILKANPYSLKYLDIKFLINSNMIDDVFKFNPDVV